MAAARRRAPSEDKREFIAACEDFADGHLLRAFSLVGTRGDADLMLLSQAQNLERIHEFHVVLAQSGLMKWCTIPYSFLAMTKPSEYSDESRLEVRPAHGKYLFVYPFVKTRAWYTLPADERWRIMQDHIKVGREYPSVDLNTTYSFGLDDQEFVVAFETDNPADFLDLVQRLRTTESSSYTLRDTPTFTCIAMSVERALGALDGAALTVTVRGRDQQPPTPSPHLRAADPVLAGVIDESAPTAPEISASRGAGDHYGALVRSIVGQQLSTGAARAIYARLTDRFGGRTPTPGGPRGRPRGPARGGRAVPRQGRIPAFAGRARARRLARPRAPGSASRRGGDRRADRRHGASGLERRHVPDVPPGAARRPGRSATWGSAGR